MDGDYLTPDLVCEAIVNAPAISKIVKSKNPETGVREKLYIIKGFTLEGISIYTKGKFDKIENEEVFYVLISSKRATV